MDGVEYEVRKYLVKNTRNNPEMEILTSSTLECAFGDGAFKDTLRLMRPYVE